ncbi:MAG TPA: hypothetical protein VGD54_19855 [Steroidobacteraceae bacterium]
MKTALVLGLLFSLIAPEALSQPLIDSASNATIPATLLSLALLAMGLEELK